LSRTAPSSFQIGGDVGGGDVGGDDFGGGEIGGFFQRVRKSNFLMASARSIGRIKSCFPARFSLLKVDLSKRPIPR
jgi:hypothetical protein